MMRRAERMADSGVVNFSYALSVSPRACELLRNAWLAFIPIIYATACHQRHYLETDSRCNNRLPKAPQVLAAGRPWSNVGELGLLLGSFTVVIRSVGRIQKRYSLRHGVFPSCKVWLNLCPVRYSE